MTQQEIIQRIYGEYYEKYQYLIDEWGRIKSVELVALNEDEIVKKMSEDLNMEEFPVFDSDIKGEYVVQPKALKGISPEPTPQLTKQDISFIDDVAIQTMLFYLRLQQPASFKDSLKASRVAYRQALAMWDVKTNGLQDLADEEKIKIRV